MKSYFLSIIALLIFTTSVQAQHVNIGIKGGLNLYNVGGDASSGNNSKVGFNLGLLGHIHQDNHFAIQPEIVYSVQGTRYKTGGNDVDLNLNYLNIPILFQYMFDNGFRLQAGPQLGLLTSAKTQINNSSTDVKNQYNDIDLGLGFGLSYVNPPTGFGVDLRYNLGLTDIHKSEPISQYNKGFQLGVFYIFNQSHKS